MSNMIKLTSVIDQQEAQKMHDLILDTIQDVKDFLEIDASVVERIGTSGVEVLIATDQYLKNKKAMLKVKTSSGAFDAAFIDLGFNNLLQEWKVK
jgi:anti-anti-sigma regulatory factor